MRDMLGAACLAVAVLATLCLAPVTVAVRKDGRAWLAFFGMVIAIFLLIFSAPAVGGWS